MNNEDNGIYAWNPASGQVYRQDLGDGCGMQFRQYREDSLTLEIRYEDRVELFHVCSDNLTSGSLSEEETESAEKLRTIQTFEQTVVAITFYYPTAD